jgi:hypothetical protein
MKKNKVLLIFSVLFLLLLSLNVFGALSDNLQIYYKMDNSSGAEIDFTNHNNGTHYSTTRGVSGKLINSTQFSASSGDGVVSDSAFTWGTNIPQTFNAWVYSTSSDAYPTIVSQGDSRVFLIYTSSNSDGKIRFLTGASGGSSWNDYSTNVAFSINNWNMITLTYNSTNAQMYLNGNSIYNATPSYSPATSVKLYLGAENSGLYGTFVGKIDEVALWNRTLNSSEISQLYNEGNGLSYADITYADITYVPTPINFTYTKTCYFNGTGLSLNLMSGCY